MLLSLKPTTKHKQNGFTLIELLVVIGILGILLSITLVALNPKDDFQKANNTQRQSDVNTILNAINQYMADNKGAVPTGISTTVKNISSSGGAGDLDLCTALVPKYVADLPIDPTTGAESPLNSICTDLSATYITGYTVKSSAVGNRITVSAPAAEDGATIAVTR